MSLDAWCPGARSRRMFSLVAHGWNIDIGAELIGLIQVRFFGSWNGSGWEGLHVHAVGS